MAVFVNEVDYVGSSNEYVEVAGPAGTDLSGYKIELYDSSGSVIATQNLSGTISDAGLGSGVRGFTFNQESGNDSTGGVAIVDGSGDVVQFVGFNGTVTGAVGTSAEGMNSTNFGVPDVNLPGFSDFSAQLGGTGEEFEDFSPTWGSSSQNQVNSTQTLECFVTGTRVLTENGYRLVEELKIGDKVKTADGKIEPIKWIGLQQIDPQGVENPLQGYPVLMKAGALGENVPCRDLYVSPDHAFLVDGLLINAGALVNDFSIVKTEPQEIFTYYQIELNHHSLIIAEGTSAESYLPQKDDRNNYDNGAEYEELYPEGSNLMLWPMDYPRISSRNKVPSSVHHKLMKIAYKLTREVLSVSV